MKILKPNIGICVLITIIISYIMMSQGAFAQCNQDLVEKAVMTSGIDAVYLRDFKIKYIDDKKIKVPPVARFNTVLNEGKLYRFTIENAPEYEGRAILQLMEREKLLGSTYHMEKGSDEQSFEYLCEKTGMYKVLMSFLDGKKGCAAGVLSLVIDDSTKISDPVLLGADTIQTLYIGVENPLAIAATKTGFGAIDVQIDNGRIVKNNGFYSAFVEDEGKTTIKVTVTDTVGNIREESIFYFNSQPIPLPVVSLGGYTGGLVYKKDLIKYRSLQLHPVPGFETLPYTIQRFSIGIRKDGMEGITAYGKDITYSQQKFINNLNPGATLFVKNIVIKTPDGNEQVLPPLGFIVD